MPGILALVPSWAWRWIAIIGVAAALYGVGYLRGFLHEEHKFAAYQAKVDEIGRIAAAHVAQVKASQDKTTKETADEYSSYVQSITRYYASHPRVVRVPASCGAVPATADSPRRPDAAPSEPSAAGPDIEQACALDAARINAWRAFALKNHFPVE